MKACKIDEIGRIVLVGDGIELSLLEDISVTTNVDRLFELYFANKGNQFLLLKVLLTF